MIGVGYRGSDPEEVSHEPIEQGAGCGGGIPAGVIAALRPGSVHDSTVMLLSNVGFAVPNFLVATLLIYYVALKLD